MTFAYAYWSDPQETYPDILVLCFCSQPIYHCISSWANTYSTQLTCYAFVHSNLLLHSAMGKHIFHSIDMASSFKKPNCSPAYFKLLQCTNDSNPRLSEHPSIEILFLAKSGRAHISGLYTRHYINSFLDSCLAYTISRRLTQSHNLLLSRSPLNYGKQRAIYINTQNTSPIKKCLILGVCFRVV